MKSAEALALYRREQPEAARIIDGMVRELGTEDALRLVLFKLLVLETILHRLGVFDQHDCEQLDTSGGLS